VALGTDSGGKIVAQSRYVDISFVIDGGGSPITTGSKGYLQIPTEQGMHAYGWTVFSNQTGSISVSAKQGAYASFPSDTDLGYPIGLSSQNHNGNWSAGNVSLVGSNFLEFYVNSADGVVQRVTVVVRTLVP
jgi:hypothetical protein